MKNITPQMLAEQQRIEQEQSSIPPLTASQRRLISTDGFLDYYLNMRDLYPSYMEAYERLEELHERITGRRKYSEFNSFKVQLSKYLKRTHQ